MNKPINSEALPLTTRSAARGYETCVKGTEMIMRFDTNEDAVAFFDWVMANTHHKKQNAIGEARADNAAPPKPPTQ
jgi:hypothetical protein